MATTVRNLMGWVRAEPAVADLEPVLDNPLRSMLTIALHLDGASGVTQPVGLWREYRLLSNRVLDVLLEHLRAAEAPDRAADLRELLAGSG